MFDEFVPGGKMRLSITIPMVYKKTVTQYMHEGLYFQDCACRRCNDIDQADRTRFPVELRENSKFKEKNENGLSG